MLAAGWLMWCAAAAWRIEPSSATLRSRSSDRMSGTGSANGIRKPYRVATILHLSGPPSGRRVETWRPHRPVVSSGRRSMPEPTPVRVRSWAPDGGAPSRPRAGALIAVVATVLGHLVPVVGAPVFAVLGGIATTLVRPPAARARPGLDFAAKTVLKASIVVLGTGLSFHEVVTVGGTSLPVLVGTLAVALLGAVVIGRALGVSRDLRTLIGVGTGDLRRVGHRRHGRGDRRLRPRRLLCHRHHLHLQRGRRAVVPDHRPRARPLTPRVRPVGGYRRERPLLGRCRRRRSSGTGRRPTRWW